MTRFAYFVKDNERRDNPIRLEAQHNMTITLLMLRKIVKQGAYDGFVICAGDIRQPIVIHEEGI